MNKKTGRQNNGGQPDRTQKWKKIFFEWGYLKEALRLHQVQ